MFDHWRIVFGRSKGAVFVHAAVGENHEAGIPEVGWRYCDVDGDCKDDETLKGELHFV